MNKESLIEYIERHVEGELYQYRHMNKFISYEQMLINLKEIFDMAKFYHKCQMVKMLKYVMHYENQDGQIITEEDYDAFAEKIFDKFFKF
jgi:hypothetical protein